MSEAVAGLLREYAELLAITGGDPFRARNYEKAAKAVAGHPADVTAMSEPALTSIPGVGKSIAAKRLVIRCPVSRRLDCGVSLG